MNTKKNKISTVFIFICLIITASSANADLIHHWDFEDNPNDTGTLANAPGILYGDAAYVPGKVGQAISLDGNGDFVLADVTNVVGTVVPATDYTLAAWVYWDGANSMRGRIAGGQLSGGEGEVFTLSRSADGSDRKLFTNLLPNNATSVTESADNTVSTGSWMHVAYTISSTEGVKIYLDGNVVGTNPGLTTHTSANNFGIGVRADIIGLTSGIYYFDGLIDDVRIYDTVLSAAEIAGIMDDQKNPTVDAGSSWITWSGQAVTVNDAVVTNNDPDAGDLTLQWTAESIAGISVGFSETDVAYPAITVIKDPAAANPTTVTLTLAVTQTGKDPVIDTMEIDVFDNSCDAGKSVGSVTLDETDFNGDCVTNLQDLAIMAAAWLVDYQEDSALPK